MQQEYVYAPMSPEGDAVLQREHLVEHILETPWIPGGGKLMSKSSGIAQSSSLLICESGWMDGVTRSRLDASQQGRRTVSTTSRPRDGLMA
jgi:hypothetical protein